MDKTPAMQKLRGKKRTQEWSPVEFKTKEATTEGSVMSIASTGPITVQKENTIKNAADLMAENHVRRLYVTGPDKTLVGVLNAMDLVDFLGGGDRFKLVSQKHQGNLLAAINEPIREIMCEKVASISHRDSIKDALSLLLETGHGGLPVLDNGKLVGAVTERDFVLLISKQLSSKKVCDVMSRDVIFGSAGMQLSDLSKEMLRNHFRRIPILSERELVGIVTSRDVVAHVSQNFSADVLEHRLDKIMHKPVTTTSNELVENAAALMRERDVGGLPIIEGEKVVGILTERDILETTKRCLE